MKILLVNPSKADIYGAALSYDFPPLSLGYIGAVLDKAGHQVKIIDIDTDRISKERFLKIIKGNYELVGFTATTPTFKEAEKLCRLVKEDTNAVTVLGGIHATIAPHECLQHEHIDFLVRGEGEVTILDLINAIQDKKDYQGVKGISYRREGRVVHTPDRELIKDLDEIPFPARHLFNQQKYNYPDAFLTPILPIITSRGCPHDCSYCCTKLIFSRKVRFRSPKNVVDEIEQLIKKYHAKEIHIIDDNYTCNKRRVFEIGHELKKRKIKLKFAFPNCLRADQVDKEILKCLKDMGVYQVGFGVESGNQAVLNNAKRGLTLEQIEKAYSSAKQMGLETLGNFIFGLLNETEGTIKDTIKFAKEINPDIAKFHILKPFPGTEVFYQLREKGLMTEFDYSKYGINTRPVHRLPGLSEDDLIKWQKKAYREFYLRPSKIIKLLLRIKSWKRAKLVVESGFSIFKLLKYVIFPNNNR